MNKLSKKDKFEVDFWKKAIELINKGYGEGCQEDDENCDVCKANKVVKWIEGHIDLIENW